MKQLILSSLFLLACIATATAQRYPMQNRHSTFHVVKTNKINKDSVFSILRGEVVDSATRKPVPGALVSILSQGKRARHISADKKGLFEFTNIPRYDASIEITHLGYRIFAQRLDSTKRETLDLGQIQIAEDAQQIDAVVVQMRLQFFSMKGDTILFNPRAVKTMDDDMALEIMKQMPGVVIKDEQIEIMGEKVAVTYVNGKPLYGENAMTALKYIEASMVTSVKAYDETDVEASVKRGAIKKRKVLNVTTNKNFSQNITGSLLGSYGADMNKASGTSNQRRYAYGLQAGLFSERTQYQLEASNSNSGAVPFFNHDQDYINNGVSNAYNRTSNVNLNLTTKVGTQRAQEFVVENQTISRTYYPGSFSGGYTYNNSYTRSGRTSQRLYFPSQDYKSRELADTSQNTSQNGAHTVHLAYQGEGDVLYNIVNDMTFDNSNNNGYNGGSNVVDGKQINRTSSNNQSHNNKMGFNIRGHIMSMKNGISANGSLAYGDSDSNGLRIDTLQTSTRKSYLVSNGSNKNYTARVAGRYNIKLSSKNSVGLGYDYTNKNVRSIKVGVDQLTGAIDTTNTQNYTDRSNAHALNLSYYHALNKKLRLNLTASQDVTTVVRDENFPNDSIKNNHYFNTSGSMMMLYAIKKGTDASLHYNLTAQSPSLEMLDNKLDNSNPLLLSSGNPDLKATQQHSIQIHYNTYNKDGRSSLNLGLSGTLEANGMSSKQTYFTKDTYLPQYDYTAQAGSTLQTNVNLNGQFSVEANVRYSLYFKQIKSNLSTYTSVTYQENPTYIGDRVIVTNSTRTNVNIQLITNFSRKFKLNIMTNSGFENSRNSSDNTNQRFNQQASMSIRCSPHKRLFISTNFSYSYVHSSEDRVPDSNDNTWNAQAGWKFLKNNRGILSVSVRDILNRKKSFTTSMQEDYILNSWEQLSSRYFTVNLRFNINDKR